MIKRWLYSAISLSSESYGKNEGLERTLDEDEAVLRSSEIMLEEETGVGWMDDLHAPAIDIDMECTLLPSSTEGHYHLYIDKPMSWANYEKLLTVMNDVGIVQDGFLKLARENKKTFLRVRDKSEDPRREKPGKWNTFYPCQAEYCEVCSDNFAMGSGLTETQTHLLWLLKYGIPPLDFGTENITPPWKVIDGVLHFDLP